MVVMASCLQKSVSCPVMLENFLFHFKYTVDFFVPLLKLINSFSLAIGYVNVSYRWKDLYLKSGSFSARLKRDGEQGLIGSSKAFPDTDLLIPFVLGKCAILVFPKIQIRALLILTRQSNNKCKKNIVFLILNFP